jgi:hypothetical protein
MRSTLVSLVPGLLGAASALACPLCHTETGQQVRAAVFGPGFWFNLLVTMAPFFLFIGLTAIIYYGIPMPKKVLRLSWRMRAVKGEAR